MYYLYLFFFFCSFQRKRTEDLPTRLEGFVRGVTKLRSEEGPIAIERLEPTTWNRNARLRWGAGTRAYNRGARSYSSRRPAFDLRIGKGSFKAIGTRALFSIPGDSC